LDRGKPVPAVEPLMPELPYELAIFGSTPLAGLLAGLLAGEHGKRVCLVGEASSPFRLMRGIDLSGMPVTRPETWALLRQAVPETLRLLRRIGARQGVQRTDVVFVGETADGIDALSHMLHVARGFDFAVERMPVAADGSAGFRLRDAVALQRAPIEAAIADWLGKAGVGVLPARDAGVTIRRDGSSRIEFAGATIEANHAVLADDAAIIAHLETAERDRTLLLQSATAMLTEPTSRLAAPLMVYPDRGVALWRARRGSIFALSRGRPDEAMARVGACLAPHGPLRRVGQRVFRTVATVDGAPLVGVARGLKATVLAGLGTGGAFLAPALARLLAGVASDSEKAYFAAREAGRGNARAYVADYAGARLLEARS
jgi:hypothetical protein